MPLLRINILILSIAFSLQSIFQGMPSLIYVYAYTVDKAINIEICSAIRLFGNTVHGVVDFIPFSLAVIRYNLIFGKGKKFMWLFWIFQVILVIVRLTTGIYPTISKNSKYAPHTSCGYVKVNSDPFMISLRIFSLTSEVVFPIAAFIINIIILNKVLINLRRGEKGNERKEQRQLFWSMSIQILMPFFCHIPSINLAILRMIDFHETFNHLILVDALNTIAYSSSVFLSIVFIDKLRKNLFNVSCCGGNSP